MIWFLSILAFNPQPLSLPGVPQQFGKIEILRDNYGIPHVFSDTDEGAMYGLGYATAQARGFQMTLNLRSIQGRMAEMIGDRPKTNRSESAAVHDRKMRTFGFYRAAKVVAENLDADSKALLAAYCRGVNDSFATNGWAKHPMFEKYGVSPELWTPADCIAVWWQLGQFFATDGTRELIQFRNRNNPQAGRGGMQPPKPTSKWFDDEAAVVQREDVSADYIAKTNQFLRESYPSLLPRDAAHPEGPKFSHAWVVGGKKAGGSAVLISDPQTPVRYPSLWMEFHVCGKTFNARGVGVPGSPGLLIGWNENVAWGATALGADQADLFRLKTDEAHPNQYWLDGKWEPMQIVDETIAVKHSQPINLKVRLTKFGPIVTEFAFAQRGDPEVALRRVPICITDRETIQALFGFMRARNVSEFRSAVSRWQFPSANLVFGDKHGDIGYSVAAAIPIRSPRDGDLGKNALEGNTLSNDWRGYVPADLLPQVINPKRGWIASGNHRPIASFYRIPIGISTGSMGHTLRSWRLYELLSAKEKFTPAEVLAMHYDSVNPARREIVRLATMVRARSENGLSNDARMALAQLKAWKEKGARSEINSSVGVLAGEISLFFRMMATPVALEYGGGESGLCRFLKDATRRLEKDPNAKLSDDELALIDRLLTEAWQAAQEKYGEDPSAWSANARRQLKNRKLDYLASLDGFGSLDRTRDLSFPDLDCIDGGTIKSQAAQSYTQYVPLGNVDSAMSLLPIGHSDIADDAFAKSTMETWSQAKLVPAPLSRPSVERIAKTRMELKPSK